MKQAKKNIGYSLQVKSSLLEHHESGEGVFLSIDEENEDKFLPAGSLMGLVPGLVFDSITDFENYHGREHPRDHDEYLHRYDDCVIDFSSKIFYPSHLANNL